MLRNNTLRTVIIVLAIIFVILLTFAYGNYLRQQKSGQNKPSDQSVQENDKNKQADNNTDQNKSNDNKSTNESSSGSSTPQQSNQSPNNNPPSTATNVPTTGAGDAVLPLSILSLLVVEYFRVHSRRRSLQVSRSKVE